MRNTFFRLVACCVLSTLMINAQMPVIVAPQRLFGWADLHAHPATHLAFGSDSNGENGIFWGKPGGKWYNGYAYTDTDMPPCPYIHGGFDADVVRHETHKALMQTLDSVTEYPHLTSDFGANNYGGPKYDQWPNASSLSHQQMHVTELRRAYDGGQRILVASVTDNELLTDLWTKIGFNAGGNAVPEIDPAFGYNSALKQINFIKDFVGNNATWMEIASTAADARRIVAADKLAVILSLEVDTLSESQVLNLVDYHGVRQVIPIHLIDNKFGGTAVYGDAFNTVNNFVNTTRNDGHLVDDGFQKVQYDSKLKFRLGWPNTIRSAEVGAVKPVPVSPLIYAMQNYNLAYAGGHRNQKGLNATGTDLVYQLAKRGVLIDIAHMSQESTHDTMKMAINWGYPVMDSHTNLREADGTANSERDLHGSHATIISDLGGVIGFGTEWHEGFLNMADYQKISYLLGYNPQIGGNINDPSWYEHAFALKLPADYVGDPDISAFKVRIETGDEDLSGDLTAILNFDGSDHSFRLNEWHENWRPGLVTTSTIQLLSPVKSSKLKSIKLKVTKGDQWRIKALKVDAVPVGADPVQTWTERYKYVLSVMGGKGVMIGTDINGFAPQIAIAAKDATYPISVAHQYGPTKHTPLLSKFVMGTKMFDFKEDGIAHYGMLPDFLQAVSQQPDTSAAMDAMFHSADDVVLMWEKCAKVAPTVTPVSQ